MLRTTFILTIVLGLASLLAAKQSATTAGPSPATTPTSQATAQSSAAPPVQDENARRARTLLDQATQALGGQAYLNIQDMEQEGRTYAFYHGESQGAGTLFWRFWKWPDKDRFELTKQRDVVEVYNGDQGWEVTFRGVRPHDPKDLAKVTQRRHYALDQVLRNWLKEPNVALFYSGTALAAGRQADQVTVSNDRNESVDIFLDTNTHLPVQKTFRVRDPEYHDKNVESEIYDSYRTVQGIATPFTVTRTHNGEMENQRFITKTTYNMGLPDAMFEPKGAATKH
jgi:hypothetical protein